MTGDALTGLVRRVLLAALELRQGRLRHEEDHRAATWSLNGRRAMQVSCDRRAIYWREW